MTIPQPNQTGPLAGASGLQAKLWPNGEVVVFKPRAKGRKRLKEFFEEGYTGGYESLYRVALLQLGILPPKADGMGLSPQKNFDKLLNEGSLPHEGEPRTVSRYGRNGITAYGARRVRNCCHELQSRAPKQCVAFATCTVPELPIEMMARLHESWNVVVDAYRRKLRRKLRDDGLSGDSVTVSEIQSKRYQRTGIPVLHLHTVFVGRRPGEKWAISTKDHDEMWRSSLSIVLGEVVSKLDSACNIQAVKKSAEGYLGKYMSKGTSTVRNLCKEGFEGWLPKQWWSATRSLCKAVDNKTRFVPEFAEWLNHIADVEGADVWTWHKDVVVEMSDGQAITMARYGRIKISHVAEIFAFYEE